MSDGRKRLSGNQYKYLREEKKKKTEEVLKKTPKLKDMFKKLTNSDTQEQDDQKVQEDSCSNSVDLPEVNLEPPTTFSTPEDACSPRPSLAQKEDSEPSVNISEDPSNWIINEYTCNYIANQNFKQDIKKLNFTNSKHVYSDQTRYCPISVFRRKLPNGEETSRDWIVYSEKLGRVFCAACLLLKNIDSQFGSGGFYDWKNVVKRVQEHENSTSHKTCAYNFLCRQNKCERIDLLLGEGTQNEIVYWRSVLERVVAVVKSLSSRGLGLRGKEEKLGTTNNGNFLMCIELLAQFDPFLADHIARYGGKGSGTTSYLSKTTYEEFIKIIAKRVQDVIVEELKQAKYFSIVVDSTPDIAHTDQLAFIVRYVRQDGVPVERFLKFLPNVGHKAADMFNTLMENFKYLNIEIVNCRGQSYDNAANMSGIYNGLQAKIKDVCPEAYYVPCSAHSLNLVGNVAAACCLETTNFFSVLQELYNFFGASTVRWSHLQSKCNKTLKSLSTTRWSARDDTCKTLNMCLKEIYETLCWFEEDTAQKPITRNDAKSLRQKLERFETTFMIVFWVFFLERINVVNTSLQKVETNIIQTITLYDSLIALFKSARDKFDLYENDAKKICVLSEVTYEKDHKRKKIAKLRPGETRDNEVVLTGRDEFRVSTFLPIIDSLLVEILKRRACYEEFNKKISFLDISQLRNMSSSEFKRTVLFLQESYPNDLDINFEGEASHFLEHVLHSKKDTQCSILELYKWFNTMNLKSIYPSIDIVFRLCICLPVSNCSAERSFSCLKRIKTYLRSTLEQERLEALAILNIEPDVTNNINFIDIINDFAEKKVRKKM